MEEEAHEFSYRDDDHFAVDDLLVDFSDDDDDNHDEADDIIANSNIDTAIADTSKSWSPSYPANFGSVHRDVQDGTSFSGDLCAPSDELAELEWLSNFVEEPFSAEDVDKLQRITGFKTRTDPKTACSWTSSEFLMEAVYENPFTGETILSTFNLSPPSGKKPAINEFGWKKEVPPPEKQQCVHCATSKTPQWRTGPLGPKTLCNACGVRYIVGSLVPEYRPESSPTFVLSKHSNSRRRVTKKRRQKEMTRVHRGTGNDMIFNGNVGPDLRYFT